MNRKMFKKGHLHEEGDTPPLVAVKHEMVIVEDENDEIDASSNLEDLKYLHDPLEISETEREFFLKQEELQTEEPTVVLRQRGAPGLVYQGYTYNRYYIYKMKLVIRWRCQQNNCRGCLDTNLKCKVARVQEGHNHPPNYIATEAAKLKYNLFGHQLCNFFREDGTFMVPYKENAKKKLKALNPFGIQSTLKSLKRSMQYYKISKNTVSG